MTLDFIDFVLLRSKHKQRCGKLTKRYTIFSIPLSQQLPRQ